MRNFEWNWFIGCTAAVAIVVAFVVTIYLGSSDNNQRYYASMDKCIAAGGSFIPMRGGEAICMIGNKQ